MYRRKSSSRPDSRPTHFFLCCKIYSDFDYLNDSSNKQWYKHVWDHIAYIMNTRKIANKNNIVTFGSMRILLVWVFLILFWMFSMYSVSIFESFDFTRQFLWEPSNYYYFFQHLEKLLIGLGACIIVYFTPLNWFKKTQYLVFFGTLLLTFLLFWYGAEFWKGSRRWIEIAWWTIQPWELFKFGFVLFMSGRCLRKSKQLDDFKFFLAFCIVTCLSLIVFIFLPDIGTLMVLGPVALIMYRYSWGKPFYVLITLILWVMATVVVGTQFDYVQQRLGYFFNSDIDVEGRDIRRQSNQALIAVWWWWLIGQWYGKWLQKFGYIPEAQSDFIFAAFSEEVWFVWWVALILGYFFLAWYVLLRLENIPDPYYRNLAVGILSLILIQAFVNIWVNIKLIPLTWLTLPFVSHGWTALIINMVEVVMLYKVSRLT